MAKFDPETLAALVLSRTGAAREDVLVGPAYGEDAAAVSVGDETLVVSTDPVSLAAERIGTLAVDVATNDVAACGGVPAFLAATLFLPRADRDLLDAVTGQIDAAAERLGVAVVGGHTETVAGLDRPLVSLTAMGVADRYVPTSGASPGDRVLCTKAAGIEATGVLATDFRADLLAAGVPESTVETAETFFDDVSVAAEGVALAPHVDAMHDPTEGGVLGGLVETATASGVRIDVDREAVPVREATRDCCAAMGLDPLRVLGSGAMVATCPPSAVEDALAACADAGVEAAVVGDVEAAAVGDVEAVGDGDPGVVLDGEFHAGPVEDGMYALW
jgi:hydrogenase expression/formation protein HypE